MEGSYTTETRARRLQSPREPTGSHTEPTSRRWWGLDWSHHFPWVHEDIEFVLGSIDDALPFITEHYPALFADRAGDDRFLAEPMSAAKIRIYREADVFLMKDGARVIGLVIGHPSDPTTYYVRTGAVLPEHQGRHLAPRLIEYMVTRLAAVGVERMESDVVVANHKSLIAHLRTGFVIAGTHVSERYGALSRVTRHIGTEARGRFSAQFCPGDP